MKTLHITAVIGCLLGAFASPSRAGEHVTLTVQSEAAQAVASETITLDKGDTAELVFSSYTPADELGPSFVNITGTVGDKPFTVPVARVVAKSNVGTAYDVNRVKIAGPATLKLQIGAVPVQRTEFATIEVKRAGNASSPAGIPQEADTNWEVSLEASTDLVLWKSVPTGTYPGNTPQRFFRVRLVKKP